MALNCTFRAVASEQLDLTAKSAIAQNYQDYMIARASSARGHVAEFFDDLDEATTFAPSRPQNAVEPWAAEMMPSLYEHDWIEEEAVSLRAELTLLQRCHHRTLQALGEASRRAERAERWLWSRVVALTWPATLGGIVGGFAAVVGLRFVGM